MGPESLFGLLPDHWEVGTVGGACSRGGGDVQTGPFGSQLHASDYVAGGVPSIMPQNIGDNRVIPDGIARITPKDAARLSRYLVKAGDIVYSRRGDVERRALIRAGENGWLCGTGCLRIRLGDGYVDPAYMSYYLGHPEVRKWIVRHAVGATMPNLNTSILSAVPFVRPPLSEQRAIAHILGSLDDKIELNRRMNATLEAMARALFQSWFVDFDPVRAKAEGRHPAGMDAETAALFPSGFDDTDYGPVPSGWNVTTVGDACEFAYGKALKEGVRQSGEVPVYGSNGRVGWHNEALVGGPGVVVGRKGNPGTVTWVQEAFFPIDTTFYVVPLGILNLHYLRHALSTQNLANLSADSAVPGLNRNLAYRSLMLLPPTLVLDVFESFCAPLALLVAANARSTGSLSTLRDTLLPKLLSGEIRVREAERELEAVL